MADGDHTEELSLPIKLRDSSTSLIVPDNRQLEPAREIGYQGKPESVEDPNLISWDGPDDAANPMNWKRSFKWLITMSLGSVTFCVAISSSIFSTGTKEVAELYHVSVEVAVLGTALFILLWGFCFGPLLWGPISEALGRKKPLFLGLFAFCIFQIPVAVAQNLYTILICRFMAGFASSSALTVVGGILGDIWDPVTRGVAVCVFAGAAFIGPVVGPIMGGFITMSYIGWRWNAYITLIISLFLCVTGFFIIPETFGPVILQAKAHKIRLETRNWAIHSAFDAQEINMKSIIQVYLTRPYIMLTREPVLLLLTIYMSLIYGILYLFFEGYPISFQQHRGWNARVGALPFIGLLVGIMIGAGVVIYLTKTRFALSIKTHGRVIPEERLPPMILGAAVLPAGLFWFAWTSSPNITWVPQVLSGIPIGMGIFMIFLQGMNYIIDVYMQNANSAMAANVMLRSISGAAFPLFTQAMYDRLGVSWATTLLALLCVAMFPIPVLFYYYGPRLRKMSSFSPTE
ncbi:putative MFS multidrug transporter [Mollisia scopiformis]|uniref:Putative MFS multidrug transporter n=1 Tax=Mollisia scopiformis TaxID=149040 RepID=A0A194XGQ8_MOLSC|nr:putative MFS multidrug transporter [Mollisia scopiformis]KUJ19385.1 putative MFS multidrug transporter [Mollisia scopiformis]